MKRLLFLLIPLLVLAACGKGSDTLFSGAEMGFIRDGDITTDNGTLLHVTESPADLDIVTPRRVMAWFEASLAEDGAYNIRLLGLRDPQLSDPVPAEEVSGDLPDDPVDVVTAWFGGGYLNLQVLFFKAADPDTPHTFTLTWTRNGDSAVLRLYHDGNGENYGTDGDAALTQVRDYLCFPMEDIVRDFRGSGAGNIPVSLRWLYYGQDGGSLSPQTQIYELTGTYPLSGE